ncbi:ACT domain protein [Streptococcus mitis SK321]|nr:ACT domain protein [Streptococcus mitis SK321]
MLLNHGDGFSNLSNIHDNLLDIIHSFENRCTLNIDFHIQNLPKSFKFITKISEILFFITRDDSHHRKIFIQDSLRDIINIQTQFCNFTRNTCNNSRFIFTNNSYNRFHK